VNNWYPEHLLNGWKYALDSLSPITSERGILFDGFVDKRLSFGDDTGDRRNCFMPHEAPWIGVMHNPPTRPQGFSFGHSADELLVSAEWIAMAQTCRGLITLSEYHARWLRSNVSVPVKAVLHPFPNAPRTFMPQALRSGIQRRLVHIGSWLRNYRSFAEVYAPRYTKVITDPAHVWNYREIGRQLQNTVNVGPLYRLAHLPPEAYRDLLCTSVAFLDLLDVSACNAILDCISHHTPLIIRPHPAVLEYLGSDYPLFYSSHEEAASLLENTAVLLEAHAYLESRSQLVAFRSASFRDTITSAVATWSNQDD
jgi:hypothetical protein